MSRRRRVLEEEGGIAEAPEVPDEATEKYRVEIVFTDGVQTEAQIDAALNAAVAELES